jgi:hypothetical protein
VNAYGLPVTGVGGAVIAGIYLDQLRLVAIGLALVLLGAVIVRLTYRKNKSVGDR